MRGLLNACSPTSFTWTSYGELEITLSISRPKFLCLCLHQETKARHTPLSGSGPAICDTHPALEATDIFALPKLGTRGDDRVNSLIELAW